MQLDIANDEARHFDAQMDDGVDNPMPLPFGYLRIAEYLQRWADLESTPGNIYTAIIKRLPPYMYKNHPYDLRTDTIKKLIAKAKADGCPTLASLNAEMKYVCEKCQQRYKHPNTPAAKAHPKKCIMNQLRLPLLPFDNDQNQVRLPLSVDWTSARGTSWRAIVVRELRTRPGRYVFKHVVKEGCLHDPENDGTYNWNEVIDRPPVFSHLTDFERNFIAEHGSSKGHRALTKQSANGDERTLKLRRATGRSRLLRMVESSESSSDSDEALLSSPPERKAVQSIDDDNILDSSSDASDNEEATDSPAADGKGKSVRISFDADVSGDVREDYTLQVFAADSQDVMMQRALNASTQVSKRAERAAKRRRTSSSGKE